jgi:hypothetical protein
MLTEPTARGLNGFLTSHPHVESCVSQSRPAFPPGKNPAVDWREWFLRNGDLRVWLTPLCSVPVSSAIGGEYMSPVSIRNDLEILPDVMLRNTAEYRSILHPDSTGTAFTSLSRNCRFT